jgi:hypothetical protein
MRTESSEKDKSYKKKSSKGLTGSLTEDLWNKDEPESELEAYNQKYNNQVADQHVEASEKNNGEEKPPQEKKLRTILYSETKEVNGKEEVVYDEDFLKKIGAQSKKIDMLNGIDFTEYITTDKEDLNRMQINPFTDLVYEISDDSENSDKLGDTFERPREINGVIHGNINVGRHTKEGVNNDNLHINLGRTLAHERLAHGYNNILNNLTGKTDLSEHTKGGYLTDEGKSKDVIIPSATEGYKKLRHSDTIVNQTRVNIKSLHNFVNQSHDFFSNGALEYKLSKYNYTKDATRNKDHLFSIMVDKHLSGVKKAE